MPVGEGPTAKGYFNCSLECWSVFTEVLATEYGNAPLFGQIHQLTVDAYATQHAGGPHPDKSVAVHLAGLYLLHEKGVPSQKVAPLLQRLASSVRVWPHFDAPPMAGFLTVFDVALSSSPAEHAKIVRAWAQEVWDSWADDHAQVGALIRQYLA